MAPAVAALRDAAADVTVTDPAMTLLSNADGAAVTSGKEWLERIVAQVSRAGALGPVHADHGRPRRTALIELPPAGTLTGLARRALPGVATARAEDPGRPRRRARRCSPSTARPTPTGTATCRSGGCSSRRTSGTFRAGRPRAGAGAGRRHRLRRRARARRGARPAARATSPSYGGTIIEWLVEDGDPVSAGPAPGPAAAEGSRGRAPAHRRRGTDTDATDRGPPGRPDPGLRRLPARQRVVTNDELAADRRHQRRVDPQPGRASPAGGSPARTRPWPTWPSPRAARRWRPAACPPPTSTW